MSISMFNTRTMLKALEQVFPPTTFLLKTFFPTIEKSETKYVDIDIYKGKKRLAPFVRSTQQGKMIERQGFTVKTFEPPYIKEKMITTSEEILNNRALGDTIYLGKTPQQRAAEQLMKDMEILRDMIIRREEWMASQILEDGKIAIVGDGYDAEIDFGMSASHKIAVGTITAWDNANATPLNDLKAWKRKIQLDAGLVPRIVIMGYDTWDAFIDHSSVQTLLDNRRIVLGSIEPRELPEGVEYQGDILNLSIYTYGETYLSDAGATTYYVPSKKLFMGCTNARTSRHYGAIKDLESGFTPVQYFPKTWIEKDPSSRILLVQSSPLVAMHQPDAFLCAEVLA